MCGLWKDKSGMADKEHGRYPRRKTRDFGAFPYQGSSQEHDYGEIISSLEFEEKIFEEINKENLERGLVKFFLEQNSSGGWSRKKARIMAQSIVEGRIEKTPLSKEDAKKAVKNSIEKGYIWKFKLEEPWHPKIFFDRDRLTTFPFQHKFMIAYTGKPKHIFFHREGKKYLEKCVEFIHKNVGGLNNPDSILTQGRIRGGSPHSKASKGNSDERFDKAIYLSYLREANSYPHELHANSRCSHPYKGDLTIEVEVPTNFVTQFSMDEHRWETSEALMEDFGSPEQYRKHIKKVWRETDKMDFKVAIKEYQSDGEAFLPLKYITGVWDREEYPHTPHFLPLEKYANLIKQEHPDRVPNLKDTKSHVNQSEIESKIKQKARQELEFSRKTSVNFSDNMSERFDSVRRVVKHPLQKSYSERNKLLDDVIETVEHIKFEESAIENKVKKFRGKMEDHLGLKMDKPKEVSLAELFGGFSRNPKNWPMLAIEQKIKKNPRKIVKLQKQIYDDIESDNISEQQLEAEIEKVENELIQQIQYAPLITMSQQDIDSYVRSLNKHSNCGKIEASQVLKEL